VLGWRKRGKEEEEEGPSGGPAGGTGEGPGGGTSRGQEGDNCRGADPQPTPPLLSTPKAPPACQVSPQGSPWRPRGGSPKLGPSLPSPQPLPPPPALSTSPSSPDPPCLPPAPRPGGGGRGSLEGALLGTLRRAYPPPRGTLLPWWDPGPPWGGGGDKLPRGPPAGRSGRPAPTVARTPAPTEGGLNFNFNLKY
jgi:hypothetical protein